MIQIEKFLEFYQKNSFYKLKYIENEKEKESDQPGALLDVLIFVMDKSGSMGGSRINNLKKAVIDLTDSVKTNFKNIHYITFNTIANEVSFEQIADLNADGGTSFDSANEKMFSCIEKYENGTNFTVIYFTDGEGTVNFNTLKTKLTSLREKDKDVVFNTIGFSSESNKALLIELTQAGSSFGTYKSINSTSDIDFTEFAHLFNQKTRGFIEFDKEEKKYFSLDMSNEAGLFLNSDLKPLKCILNNEEINFTEKEKSFSNLTDIEEKLKILEDYFNFELLKLTNNNSVNKQDLITILKEFRVFVEMQTLNQIDQTASIFEIEFLNEKFSSLKQTLDAYIAEAQKMSSNFVELKSLTYSNITKQKFQKRMNERAAKNEIKFTHMINDVKEIIKKESDLIDSLDINDFPDFCYLTQLNYKDLLKNMDCLGICAEITRNSEVVIVDPNFIKIKDIGYSSFVSLNSMFLSLKYYLDRSKDEQEIVNLHGGFIKNFKSSFMEGTHRSNYNAMIPLYINDQHWKIARKLLEPLFGYLVTLNIEGYTAEQYYTLYFLIFEKVILDLIDKPNSDAIKRIYDQIKQCCERVLKEFYILKPNLDEFVNERTKRTKDIWPNLSSYLLYVFLLVKKDDIETSLFQKFEYVYFEEQLRRYLSIEFNKQETCNLFKLNNDIIHKSARELFNMFLEDIESGNKVLTMEPKELIDFVFEKTNIQIYDYEQSIDKTVYERLNSYFKKSANKSYVTLFNYVFNIQTDFFTKYEAASTSIVYQLVSNGFENDKWRSYGKYNCFMDNDGQEYLKSIYLNLVYKEFNAEYGRLAGDLEKRRAELIGDNYLKAVDEQQYSKYTFIVGEGHAFNYALKGLQKNGNVNKIFHFLKNTFNDTSYSSLWKPSKKNTYRLFKVIYKQERESYISNRQNLKEDRTDFDNEIKNYPFSWKLLNEFSPRPDYLFNIYKFIIDREVFNEKDSKPEDYAVQFKEKIKFPDPISQNKQVQIYTYYPQNINMKPLADLEKEWINEQLNLKNKNILNDTELWQSDLTKLKHIGVADLITDINNNSTCVAGLMIFELDHSQKKLELVESIVLDTKLTQPYISGLLAFRECFAYQYLLNKCKIKPECLIVDGNGILHKREFGLASHLGCLENLITIGFSKKLHLIDKFPYKNLPEFKQYYQNLLKKSHDHCELKTTDNKVLGYAYLSGINSIDPVFISQGYKISLPTALNVIKLVDDYLINMKKSTRESLVGFVDKLTRNRLDSKVDFKTDLKDCF